MRNIFLDLMYGRDSIDVTGTKYQSVFEKADKDITAIKLPELLWCAVEISNILPTSEGVKFLEDIVNLASYFANKENK